MAGADKPVLIWFQSISRTPGIVDIDQYAIISKKYTSILLVTIRALSYTIWMFTHLKMHLTHTHTQ